MWGSGFAKLPIMRDVAVILLGVVNILQAVQVGLGILLTLGGLVSLWFTVEKQLWDRRNRMNPPPNVPQVK